MWYEQHALEQRLRRFQGEPAYDAQQDSGAQTRGRRRQQELWALELPVVAAAAADADVEGDDLFTRRFRFESAGEWGAVQNSFFAKCLHFSQMI